MNKIIFGILLLVFCYGCVSPKEAAKGFLGVSTKVLEDKKAEGIAKTFDVDIKDSYLKIYETLKTINAYIYSEDKTKNFIAIYVSEADTTPVGIFLTDKESVKTEILISSPSRIAKETIAKEVFAAFEVSPTRKKDIKQQLDSAESQIK